jgi:hypothetical protein
VIKDKAVWAVWEAQGPQREPADFWRGIALLDAMYDHARALGAFPPADPWEGLETKIRLARILNVSAAARADRSRT